MVPSCLAGLDGVPENRVLEAPEVRYARNGDTSIAYSVVGAGPFDLEHADVRAVMDAVGSERAAIFGVSEGGRWPRCSRPRSPRGQRR